MPKHQDNQVSVRGSFNLFYLIANVHIRCVTPFLRTRIGVRSQGFLSVVSGGAMFYTAHAIYDQMLLNYFFVWLVAVVIQRVTADKNTHSRYDGKPFIGMLLTKNQERARFIVEPLICLGVGFYLLEYSDVLGKLIMSSAFSLMFIDRLGKHTDDVRVQQVLDSRLEAQYLSEGVRKRLGG